MKKIFLLLSIGLAQEVLYSKPAVRYITLRKRSMELTGKGVSLG